MRQIDKYLTGFKKVGSNTPIGPQGGRQWTYT